MSRRESVDRANSRLKKAIGWVDKILPFPAFRPLDRIPSIKLKLSIVIGAAIGITVITLTVVNWLNIRMAWGIAIAILVAIILVQILARGLTAPLREMVRAADEMADGDYDQRVAATAADETGELGRSFNVMAARIADLERQRRELIANVSHELRTPIAALRGNIENLIDQVVDDADETLETMLRQTERLGRLVSELMDLSRLEAGAAPMHPLRMDLVAVIEDAVGEALVHDPGLEIVLDAPERLSIDGDPERLHQVFVNLLDNAVRYNPPTEPIRITVDLVDHRASIVVEDRGPGVPPAELRRIFERFYRADSARSFNRGNSGLGLAISKWIVDLHAGTITASNSTPTGLAIRVCLPIGADATDPSRQTDQSTHNIS